MGAAKKQEPAQHTPGPWHASESTAYGTAPWARRWVVNAKDPGTPGSGRLVQVVSLLGDAPRAVEDARLIAAAPELLEALADLAHPERRTDCAERSCGACSTCRARAAIAKARGES